MGHEFASRFADFGPIRKAAQDGHAALLLPGLLRSTGPKAVGYSNNNPGGYAEYMG